MATHQVSSSHVKVFFFLLLVDRNIGDSMLGREGKNAGVKQTGAHFGHKVVMNAYGKDVNTHR